VNLASRAKRAVKNCLLLTPLGAVNNTENEIMCMEVKEVVRKFIVEYFLFGDEDNLNDHTSFIEDAIVDSTGILELVAFIEETFGIHVEDEELVPENLDCISNVEKYVQHKMADTPK